MIKGKQEKVVEAKTRRREIFEEDGYWVEPGLFSAEEVVALRDHYMRLREAGSYPMDDAGHDLGDPNDPLKRYPRLIHPHRHDSVSMEWMLDRRFDEMLRTLTGEPPYAAQTMLYFKPAGARGQALHQDNAFLLVEKTNCIAAWLALDDCDEENGCMMVVPGSQKLPLLCVEPADTTRSFSGIQVPVPDGMPVAPVLMKAGDVLFFNGSLIHGSYPNVSKDRFRRSLIAHYMIGDGGAIAEFYHPLYDMAGNEVTVGATLGGDRCGTWVDTPAGPQVEIVDKDAVNLKIWRE